LCGWHILGINWCIGFINLRKLLGGQVLGFVRHPLLNVCSRKDCSFGRAHSLQRLPCRNIRCDCRRFGLRIVRSRNLCDFGRTDLLHLLSDGKILVCDGLFSFSGLHRLRLWQVRRGRHWIDRLHDLRRGQICFKHRVRLLGGLYQLRRRPILHNWIELLELRRGHLPC